MPTYVYGCDTCSHRFEIFQKFSDASLTQCPECGAPIRKIIQPAGIVFKGSGWHYTDYRGNKSSPDADGGDKAGDASGAKTEGDGAKTANKAASEKSSPPSSAPASAAD